MRIFLSHNKLDAEEARSLGANLQFAGAAVWLDEWKIEPGDSIPAKLNDGLRNFDVFLVMWSANAERSRWVTREIESAIHSVMSDPNRRVIPVVLDDTPLPPLLAPIKSITFDDPAEVVRRVLGFGSERDRLRAIQEVLDNLEIEVRYFHGYGPAVACPGCGAAVDALKQWAATDHERDDQYAGVRCKMPVGGWWRGLLMGNLSMGDLDEVYEVADRVREHLLAFPTHFDPVFRGEPSPERLFGQLVSMYNRQSFISLHICLELGHVVPAGQLARALLEESIRWEWITDEPQTRGATHVGELRRNLKNIGDECDALGVDGTSFLDPSPFWTTKTLRPFEGGTGFPKIPTMLQDIEEHGRAGFEATGEEYSLRIYRQLYVYYRVLSQITHTSLLGMTATMQPGGEANEVTVGSKVPPELMALILHVAVASVVNVCVKTGDFYVEDDKSREFVLAWSMSAMGLGAEMAEKASAIHGLAVA